MKMRVLCLLAMASALAAEERVDLSVIHRIRAEAFRNSKVMEHMFSLTDVYGPRLTNSPGYRGAGEWAVKRLREWGLDQAAQESWGPFGRGWSCTRFSAHLLEPQYSPLIGVPLAWSPGTGGPISGEPFLAPLPSGFGPGGAAPGPRPDPRASEAEMEKAFEKYKGKLRGKIVLISAPRELKPQMDPATQRFTDATLAAEAMAPDPAAARRRPSDAEATRRRTNRRNQFLRDEGALAVVSISFRGDGGTIFAGSAGSRDPKDPLPPPSIALAEIVMLGAHLDSVTAGTGATDNAAGSSVVLEALRILKALNLKMDRTVRLALWGGEEQGLLGSKAYVKQHFADRETMTLKPEHARLSGYFNIDNGTGKIRGVYLQDNDMMRPIFEAWFAPFKDLAATTISIRNTGGTDHLSFDAVGLPGFQFIQDAVEYDSRTHHSNMDVYDRIQAADLMQASAILASMVYHAATRDEMLPRKPLPKPEPPRRPEVSTTSSF